MQRKSILFSLVLLISSLANGQIFEPIKWSHELKITGKTTGEIIHKATIEAGWHLYGMNIPPDGPRPTRFVYEQLINAQKKR